MWYGKGPGVDRCGDVFRHANAAGSSQHGGVLVIAGDDHAAKSSTLPHQTEHFFKAMMMPVLAPAGVQEYLDFGVHGFALSRYSGCWVAFKALTDTVETSASVDVDPIRVQTVIPTDFAAARRRPQPALARSAAGAGKAPAAPQALRRARLLPRQRLNRMVIDSPAAAAGHHHQRQELPRRAPGLDDLGIDEATRRRDRPAPVQGRHGVAAGGRRRAPLRRGLDEILVVEEKRQFLEYQLKEELYNWREDVRPRVIGKFDEKGEWALLAARADGRSTVDHGDWLLPAAGELTPAMIARVIAGRIAASSPPSASSAAGLPRGQGGRARQPRCRHRPRAHLLLRLPAQHLDQRARRQPRAGRHRLPLHGHLAARAAHRPSATWAARACPGSARRPSPTTPHIFANLGDGTYFHSGHPGHPPGGGGEGEHHLQDPLQRRGGDDRRPAARRPAVGADHRPPAAGRGRGHIVVVVTDGTDARLRPGRHAARRAGAPPRRARRGPARAAHRAGVTAIIYDQTCAAEKRRRRKRGTFPDPAKRVFINEAWCARAAATAARSRTACRWCRSRPSSAASARSTSRRATRTTPA
jgi:indolepyruvate ferredoxin oxidoreductase